MLHTASCNHRALRPAAWCLCSLWKLLSTSTWLTAQPVTHLLITHSCSPFDRHTKANGKRSSAPLHSSKLGWAEPRRFIGPVVRGWGLTLVASRLVVRVAAARQRSRQPPSGPPMLWSPAPMKILPVSGIPECRGLLPARNRCGGVASGPVVASRCGRRCVVGWTLDRSVSVYPTP
jgi:hypothetical protein